MKTQNLNFLVLIKQLCYQLFKKIFMKKKVALIFGITGQDGSYLADFLLKKKSWQKRKK